MAAHETVKGVYGPGTFTDKKYVGLPNECSRILEYFAHASPGFKIDNLKSVEFTGSALPLIPGPLKSQALVRAISNELYIPIN